MVQATAWYPPHHLGGTEVYVHGLVSELARIGVESSVLTPQANAAEQAYEHHGARVETYPVNEIPSPDELRGFRPHSNFDAFRQALNAHRDAIYHQHTWTRGCGPHHLRAAHEMGRRTVLTVHVPGNTCLRGTMLRFGEAECNGKIFPTDCAACWAEERGLPRLMANAVGRLPRALSRLAGCSRHRMATALSAHDIASKKLADVAGMIAHADRIVAVCGWLYDVLLRNGVPKDKLVLSRQGLMDAELDKLSKVRASRRVGPRDGDRRRLRILMLTRWDPVKGVDTLVRAVRELPAETAVDVRICGVPALGGNDYEASVRQLAAPDSRITIEGSIGRDGLAEAFAAADVLAVPSVWLETGPLVVLEAQAAGLFVLGSRRGGIAELVRDDATGRLVEPGDVRAWSAAIVSLVERHATTGLASPSGDVRAMSLAAREMVEVYDALTR